MAPPEKKAKTSETSDEDVKMTPEEEEAPAKLEPPKEHEGDAKPDKRPKIREPVAFLTPDTTLNVAASAVSAAGSMLLPLSEGGLRYLMAGARANVGIKSGRYAFEAKIVEQMSSYDDKQSQFRVGFSTAGASLLLGGEDSVCFDIDGSFICNAKKTPCSKRFSTDAIVSLVLNLEEGHANFNTVSLFIAGLRASQPQAIPDRMKGKALFPAVSFRNAAVHLNFGPTSAIPLPFSCRMVSEAAAQDAVVTSYEAPKDGKYEVLFPIGLPDEGCFDWLDMFLAKNPQYAEISDRAIIAWAEKSGLPRKVVGVSSNDRPMAGFGIQALDDHSAKTVLHHLASIQDRHMVVMEVKGSLVKEERSALIARFASNPALKIVAKVIVGEPPTDFKARTLDMTLKRKQEASDKVFLAKKAEQKRLKAIEKGKKEMAKKKAKMEKERSKKMEEVKKKAEAAKKLKEEEINKKKRELEKARNIAAAKAKAKAEGVEYKPDEEEGEGDGDKDKAETAEKKEEPEEVKDEEKKEEPADDEEEPEEEEEEEIDEDPPKVTLTLEEKKEWFFKSPAPDLTSWDFSTSFTKFTLPAKEDGFNEITYEWTKSGSKCASYLKDWISLKKKTTRVEDLQPSQWFENNWRQWQQMSQVWKDKANEYKSVLAKKIAEKAAAEKKAKLDAKHEALKEPTKKSEVEKQGEAENKVEEEVEKEEKAMEVDEKDTEKPEVDFAAVDIFGVEDVCDIGGKVPLFKDFQFEDWALMSLSYQLSLLVHAFRKDVDDPERPGMPLDQVAFYYNKYYKFGLMPRAYGKETMKELIELLSGAVFIAKTGCLESHLPEDMESLGALVMITEEARRHRSLLLDMGREEARLKIQRNNTNSFKRTYQGAPWRQSGGKGDKSSGKGFRFALKTASRMKATQNDGYAGKQGQKGGVRDDKKGDGKGGYYKGSKGRTKGRGKGSGKLGKVAGEAGTKEGGKPGGKVAVDWNDRNVRDRYREEVSAGRARKGKSKGAKTSLPGAWGSGKKGGAKGKGHAKLGRGCGAKGRTNAGNTAKGVAKGVSFARAGRTWGSGGKTNVPRLLATPKRVPAPGSS